MLEERLIGKFLSEGDRIMFNGMVDKTSKRNPVSDTKGPYELYKNDKMQIKKRYKDKRIRNTLKLDWFRLRKIVNW